MLQRTKGTERRATSATGNREAGGQMCYREKADRRPMSAKGNRQATRVKAIEQKVRH